MAEVMVEPPTQPPSLEIPEEPAAEDALPSPVQPPEPPAQPVNLETVPPEEQESAPAVVNDQEGLAAGAEPSSKPASKPVTPKPASKPVTPKPASKPSTPKEPTGSKPVTPTPPQSQGSGTGRSRLPGNASTVGQPPNGALSAPPVAPPQLSSKLNNLKEKRSSNATPPSTAGSANGEPKAQVRQQWVAHVCMASGTEFT